MSRFIWLIVTWFGIGGMFDRARGTWGTFAAMPFAYVIQIYYGNVALAVCGCVIFVVGLFASEYYLNETGKQDPGEIVIDEAAGIFVLLAFLEPVWHYYLAAFLVFRIFDVLKPWPVSWVDKNVKGAFGVMFDDILAALYPVGIYYVYLYFFS